MAGEPDPRTALRGPARKCDSRRSIAVETLAQLQPGAVAGAMLRAGDPAFIEEAKRLLDANDDGALALSELLDVEVVSSAIRQLADISAIDQRLSDTLRGLIGQLRGQLLPPAGGETGLPAVQRNAVVESSSPLSRLRSADPRYAALDLLRNEVAGPRHRPSPARQHDQRRRTGQSTPAFDLLGIVDGLPPLLRFGQPMNWFRRWSTYATSWPATTIVGLG